MQITLLQVGKTDTPYIREAVEVYFKRINHYLKFDIVTLPDPKNVAKLTFEQRKAKEGEVILAQVDEGDYVVLLDENGRELGSVDFSVWLQKRMNSGGKRICFVIGGPYGFSKAVYARANERISLSKMTFSHQMVRMIFCEQLYRAFTIINNELYHHI